MHLHAKKVDKLSYEFVQIQRALKQVARIDTTAKDIANLKFLFLRSCYTFLATNCLATAVKSQLNR